MDSPEEESIVNENEEDQPDEKHISITIDVSPTLYAKIEAAAAENKLSIGRYLKRIVEQYVSAERVIAEQAAHSVPSDFLEKLYRLREQILRESKGQIFEDTAEEIRRMREERTLELEARRKPLTHDKPESDC
jgi:hypothetical protein